MATEVIPNKDAVGDSSYTSQLASSLHRLRLQGTFCDINIVIDNQRFPAHKAVLSANSNYFLSMFTSGFQESGRSEVTIQDGSAESFAQLLEFAYTGYFQLSVANVCDILRMACYMDFRHAVKVCVDYALDFYHGINLDDTFEIYYLTESQFPISKPGSVLRKHLLNNFLQLAGSKTFVDHASKEFLEMCLSSAEIEKDISKEEEILQYILYWLRHDWSHRKVHSADLLCKVRLGLVPSERLKQVLGSEILAIPECNKLVEDVIKLHVTKRSAPVPLTQSHQDMFTSRNTITAPVFIEEQVLGVCLHVRIDQVCYKLSRSASLLPGTCPANPSTIQEHGNGLSLLSVGGQAYVAGGFRDDGGVALDGQIYYMPPTPQCGFFKFDSQSGLWVGLPPMPVGLAYPAMAELDGYIYTMGSSSQSYLDTYDVLRYEIETRTWEAICPLPKDLKAMSSVVLNGHILVAGSCGDWPDLGSCGDMPDVMMSWNVLALDPKKCSWSVVYEAQFPLSDCFPMYAHVRQLNVKVRQYPINIFMHNGTCYFQSISKNINRYENGVQRLYKLRVEEVIWGDCIDGKPIITLGEEVDEEATFGVSLMEEDVVNPWQVLTFDKNKIRMSRMSECSLPHNKEKAFRKAMIMW